mgnify:FL=1|jgi:hypothetical protein
MATNVKILLRRGLRSEISASTLDAGELGYTTDSKQLYVGTSASVDEIIFDPFANAQSIVQTFLNQHTAEPGLEIDEDLIIRSISDVPALLTAMTTYGVITAGAFVNAKVYKIKTVGTTDFTLIGAADNNIGTTFTATGVGTGTGTAIDTVDHFYANIFASERKNVEVLTENSFSQVYANMHLQTHTSADGRRPSLFKKELNATSGTFLKYAKTDSTSFFIDYSLKQVGTSPAITFVRVGRLQVINGAAVTPAIAQAKLTDNNTEIWQDDGDLIAQADEFSNIEFTSVIDGDNLKINYTQDANFTTEISYTVKRWTM